MDELMIYHKECLGRIPFLVSKIQSHTLYELFRSHRSYELMKDIYGFTNITVNIEEKRDQYIVFYLYNIRSPDDSEHVNLQSLRNTSILYYSRIYEQLTYGSIILRTKDLKKTLKELGINVLAREAKNLLKKKIICRNRRDPYCILSTDGILRYNLGYLVLAVKCIDSSLIINTRSLAIDILRSIYEPLREFIDIQKTNIRENISETMVETLIGRLADSILAEEIVLPREFDAYELLRDYVINLL